MRPVLMRLLLDHPWQLWADDVQGVFGVGIALVVALLGGLGLLLLWRSHRWTWGDDERFLFRVWFIALLVLTFVAPLLPEPLGRWFPRPRPPLQPGGSLTFDASPITSLPIFGYGLFVLLGFLAAKWLGERRAARHGLELNHIFDLMFWTLICGVIGGRTFYVLQYPQQIFAHAQGLRGHVFAALNLSNGGLVLIGAMLGAAAGFFTCCRRRGLPALAYLDLLTPSIFLAVAFGRIGCLMYGCCFGDPCTLPWGVAFGPESAAFETLTFRGYISPHAPATMPLHPTQIYSAVNGLLLALAAYAYYPFRTRTGQVFALGMILYAITRFWIEFLRADELGKLGTGLTISQLLCLLMLAGGLLLAWRLQRTGAVPATPRGDASPGLTAA